MAQVLVADGERHIRTYVSVLLQRAGHAVLEARDGIEALGVIDREKPDFLLLDTRMPGLDGFEVYDHLQASGEQEKIPTLFLAVRSADASLWSEHEGPKLMRCGRPYLVKPFTPEALVDAVERELAPAR